MRRAHRSEKEPTARKAYTNASLQVCYLRTRMPCFASHCLSLARVQISHAFSLSVGHVARRRKPETRRVGLIVDGFSRKMIVDACEWKITQSGWNRGMRIYLFGFLFVYFERRPNFSYFV